MLDHLDKNNEDNSFPMKPQRVLADIKDPRWRIEHSQIISSDDFQKFNSKIIPSIQPTHATSDMYWADERLGEDRLKGGYAYKKLLDWSGTIALGTDFPVEEISPFHTFYSAVARKDLNHLPYGGFQSENSLMYAVVGRSQSQPVNFGSIIAEGCDKLAKHA